MLKFDTEQREDGFSLLEILVGVIIIGILSAVAIGIYNNQRKKATYAQMKTEASALAVETSDTRSRVMTSQGYQTSLHGLSVDEAKKSYHSDKFTWNQYGYTGADKSGKTDITTTKTGYPLICQQLATKKGESKVYSVYISMTYTTAQEGACA